MSIHGLLRICCAAGILKLWYGCVVPNGCVSYYFSFSTCTLQEKEKLKLQAFNLLKILILLSTNKQTNKMITLPLAEHEHAWGNKILPPFLYFLHLQDDKWVFYFISPNPYTIGFLLAIEESHINHNSLN